MPINLKWIIPGRVAYFESHGLVEVEETLQVYNLILDGITVKHPQELFHLIADTRHQEMELSKVAQGLKTSLAEENSTLRKHPNLGWTILITDNKVMQYISSLAVQLSKNRFRIMPDLKTSLDFLKEQDQNLDWKSVNIDEIT